MGGSAPKPPDPYVTANAQGAANRGAVYASADVNSMNQYGPFGSVTYDYETKKEIEKDAKGRVLGEHEYQVPTAQHTNLDPAYQRIIDQQTQFAHDLGGKATAALGQIPTDRFSLDSIGDTSDIARTMYQRQVDLMTPEVENQRKAMEVTLSERGIPIGSEVWDTEQDRFQHTLGQQYNQIAQDADLASRNEYQRLMQNALTERQMPFNEFAALQGQIPNFPTPNAQQQPAYQVQPPDISGLVQQNYQNQVQASAQKNSMFGSLLGGGLSALAMFSDSRLKEGRKPVKGEAILEAMRDIPVDEWEYTGEAQGALGVPGGRHTGPMAQDVHAKFGGKSPSLIDLGDMVGKLLAGVKALDERTAGLQAPNRKAA